MNIKNSPKQVLYVEDSPVNAALVVEYINHIDGICILISASGEDAIELAKQNIPDLVLMDIGLPGMNGVETMLAMKKIGGGLVDIPYIALSADAVSEGIDEALKAGFDDYLTKPIFFESLKDVLIQYLHP